ncbi:hypothetical protein BT63DRAFT_452990 [Microthyrium microscopicum]|uniref:BYS1 domain protein n=1 Tax=Microthyrium microscopicum TaxID=703497 RepID=A0A6A6UM02_9PEZI|nr:hypothetical protein BT63DRAFT_452990 [Microthyrium microscopicum]
MFAHKTALAAVAALLSSQALAINGWVHNNCQSPIYVWTAAAPGSIGCTGFCSSPLVQVAPGQGYQAAFQPLPDGDGGVTVKFTTSPDGMATPYQAEFSERAGKIWYNWSGLNGSPLLGMRRSMQVGDGSSCAHSVCDAWSSTCDWYKAPDGQELNVYDCPAGDLVMDIC